MEDVARLRHTAEVTGARTDRARMRRSLLVVMSSWFSRLVAALLGKLPGRASSDSGAWILLGDGRGVSWSGTGEAPGPALSGPTPPPAR